MTQMMMMMMMMMTMMKKKTNKDSNDNMITNVVLLLCVPSESPLGTSPGIAKTLGQVLRMGQACPIQGDTI